MAEFVEGDIVVSKKGSRYSSHFPKSSYTVRLKESYGATLVVVCTGKDDNYLPADSEWFDYATSCIGGE